MTSKILTTKNYALLKRHTGENRPLDLRKHRKLVESMKLYGFLQCFPLVVRRNAAGEQEVKDGQHRLMIAEMLGLPVYYVEEETDFDVAIVNSAAKVWQTRDYAEKHAANGLKAYTEGLEFADRHGLPIGIAFSLLAGTTSFGNCQAAFVDGTFKVKDRDWADAVAGIYGPLTMMSADIKSARFIEACMALCRVKDFDARRLLTGAKRCRDKLISYSTRDAYLDMAEGIYNYGHKQMVGLKALAVMAMRERNLATAKKPAKKEAVASASNGAQR